MAHRSSTQAWHSDITSDHIGICVMVGSYYGDPPPST
jgi:hypothetical protein